VCPPDPREAFYLTTLQAELRITTLCIERGVVCGGYLTVKN